MRTWNIGRIQGGRWLETGECPKPTVVHRSSGGDQQEKEYEDILHKLLYADDLAVVADSDTGIQDWLVDWKEIFGRHGLRVYVWRRRSCFGSGGRK